MSDDESPTILLVEDDRATRTFLADHLTADGYEVLPADGAVPARHLLQTGRPDLVVLDVGLPDGSGLDLLAEVRDADGLASRVDPGLPLLVVSGRCDELDRLRGFERGCDDFLGKPFSYPELRARVRALLRRADARARAGRLRVGELEVDVSSREVALGGRRVPVTAREFALLVVLAREPTRVFTKAELLRDVWGFRAIGSTRTLDTHACRLRRKLAVDGRRFVVNVWGVGYRLVDGRVTA